MELAAEVVRLSDLAPRPVLPVDEQLVGLFPDRGLVPGQVVAVTGPAATSLAVALAARAVTLGSWLAVVGIPTFGVEAAIEAGVPASRLVAVEGGTSPLDWSERVVACADGFEVIITAAPHRAKLRRIRPRLTARGVALIVVGDHDVDADIGLVTDEVRWAGIGDGHGAVLARTMRVTATGRRIPRPLECRPWLPDAHRYRLAG